MQATDFMKELAVLYPIEQKDNADKVLSVYIEHIMRAMNNARRKYDLRKVLTYIQGHYKYRQMPSIPVLLEYLPYGETYETNYSGKEGEIIKRVVNGHEYEFTIVPNHWEGVMTISQLDDDIARWKQRDEG